MEKSYLLLLAALRAAIKDDTFPEKITQEELIALYRLSKSHDVLPLVTEALWKTGAIDEKKLALFISGAKKAIVGQAQRTGSFLLLYTSLQEKGLSPAVLKGIVCRSLYPIPEQRPSIDEDLLVAPEEFSSLDKALQEYGMTPEKRNEDDITPDERAYSDSNGSLVIEVHTTPFSTENIAYCELNTLFAGALDRTIEKQIEGITVRMLSPTDHLLYLICHAYKHLLYSGVGIRQVCDICLSAEEYAGEIEWGTLKEKCASERILRFAAGLFRIGEIHLGFSMPKEFAGIEVDETALLEDILSGGVYGTNDIDRTHSSTITLEAVASQRIGRRNHGIWKTLLPERKYMEMKYSYVKRHPWLIPVSWLQRIGLYISRTDKRHAKDPRKSMQIGKQRVALLREYGIID